MAHVVFYEKPGCKGNARQKALLAAAGHAVESHDLKREAWTKPRLFAFLSALPVAEWFNPSAPAVREGSIVPAALSADEALEVLIANPLLIRRPLLEVGEERRVGFDAKAIDTWIGLQGATLPAGGADFCAHGGGEHERCGAHADGDGIEEGRHGRCGKH